MGQTAEELRSDIELRRQSMSGTVNAIEDRVMPGRIIDRRKQAARGWLTSTRERVMGSAAPTKDRISDAASNVEQTMEETAGKVAEVPGQLAGHVAEQTRGAPLLAGGIAFGLGALLAIVIPETDPERRAGEAVAPRLSGATDALKDAGQETLEAAKGSVQQAVGELKDTATEHAGEVADEVARAGSGVGSAARRPPEAGRPQ